MKKLILPALIILAAHGFARAQDNNLTDQELDQAIKAGVDSASAPAPALSDAPPADPAPPMPGLGDNHGPADLPPPPGPGDRRLLNRLRQRQGQGPERFDPQGPGGPGFERPMGPGRPGMGPGRQEPRIDPDELLTFLQKNEPALAKKLENLRQDKPLEFARQVQVVGRIYAPIMQLAKYDPTLAQLGLKKVRLDLRVRNLRQDYQAAADKEKVRGQMEQVLGEMFDVILEQQKLMLTRTDARFEEWQGLANRPEGPRPQRERPMAERLSTRLEEQKKTLEAWQKNKAAIVHAKLEEILNEARPFPWGR